MCTGGSAAGWKAWMHVSSRQAQAPTLVGTQVSREAVHALRLLQGQS